MHGVSQTPSDHLLRTLAAVPVESRVLHVGCSDTRLCEQLGRLGFELYACDVDVEAVLAARERLRALGGRFEADPDDRVDSATATALPYPDDFFDWVVAHDVYNRAAASENVIEMVQETRRVLRPGGWLHCVVRARTVQQEDWDQLDVLIHQNGNQIGAFLSENDLDELMTELEFAEAEAPFSTSVDETPYLCGIYRKVDDDTPV
jgi:SAM-dependent methyltransferase